jgi:hypothetical protein
MPDPDFDEEIGLPGAFEENLHRILEVDPEAVRPGRRKCNVRKDEWDRLLERGAQSGSVRKKHRLRGSSLNSPYTGRGR